MTTPVLPPPPPQDTGGAMTTRRSLRSAPLDLPQSQPDTENEPAAPPGKQALANKQKMGRPRAALIDLSNVRSLRLLPDGFWLC